MSQASLPSASTQTPTPLAGTQTGSTTLRRGAGGSCLEPLISESGRQGTAGGERLLIPPLAIQLRLLSITHRTGPRGGETAAPARVSGQGSAFPGSCLLPTSWTGGRSGGCSGSSQKPPGKPAFPARGPGNEQAGQTETVRWERSHRTRGPPEPTLARLAPPPSSEGARAGQPPGQSPGGEAGLHSPPPRQVVSQRLWGCLESWLLASICVIRRHRTACDNA